MPDPAAAGSAPLPGDAAAIVDRLVKEFPENVEALFARGRIADLFGRSQEAVRCWEQCLALQPTFALAHEQIALVEIDRGEFASAAERLQRACELQPALPDARLHWGKALLAQGRNQEAAAVLEQQAAVQPGAAEVWFQLGQARLRAKEDDRAQACFEKAVAIDPMMPSAWYGMAQACERLGDDKRARDCRERFQVLDQERQGAERKRRQGADRYDHQLVGFAHTIAGEFFARQGLAAEAQAAWRSAAQVDAQNSFCRSALGQSLADENRLAEAIAVFGELQQLQPRNVDHLFTLVDLHRRSGQFAEIEKCLKRVLNINPDNVDALGGLAQFYLASGQRLSEAQRFAQRAAHLTPNGENYFVLSAICLANQDRPGAAAALQEALRLDPGNPKYIQAASVLSQE